MLKTEMGLLKSISVFTVYDFKYFYYSKCELGLAINNRVNKVVIYTINTLFN